MSKVKLDFDQAKPAEVVLGSDVLLIIIPLKHEPYNRSVIDDFMNNRLNATDAVNIIEEAKAQLPPMRKVDFLCDYKSYYKLATDLEKAEANKKEVSYGRQ